MLVLHKNWPYARWDGERLTPEAVGWISLTLCILAGATYNSFAKELSSALSPLSLLFISECLTAFFVLFSFGSVPTFRKLLRVRARSFAPLAAVAFLSGMLGPLFVFRGLQSTSAINGTLFSSTDIIILLLLSVLILKEEWNRIYLLASAIVLGGIVVIALQGFTDGLTIHSGDLFILLGTLCYSAGSIVYRVALMDIEPHIVIFVRSTSAVLMFFLLSPFLPHTFVQEMQAFPSSLLLTLIGFGFISRFLNIFTYYESIERLPVSTVSIVSSLSIVAGPLFATLYIGEPLYLYHYVGAAFILCGTLLIELLGLHPARHHLRAHLKARHHHR